MGDAPDIALITQDFSRLIVGRGRLDPEWLPDVRLRCDIQLAERVFFEKPAFISSYF